MASVTFVGTSCVYPGNESPAVDRLDLDIEDGEFMVLVGPSGSGKSRALRMVAGLEPVTGGAIQIGAADVSGMPPKAQQHRGAAGAPGHHDALRHPRPGRGDDDGSPRGGLEGRRVCAGRISRAYGDKFDSHPG